MLYITCNCSAVVAFLLVVAAIISPITHVQSFQTHNMITTTGLLTRAARDRYSYPSQLYNENQNTDSDTPKEEDIVGDQYEGMYNMYNCRVY